MDFELTRPELAIRNVWDFARRVCPSLFPPGVYKHRSIEDAEALREQWELLNFAAQQERSRIN